MSAPIEALANRSADALRQEGAGLIDQIDKLVIGDAGTLALAGRWTLDIKRFRARVKDLTAPVIDAARRALDAAREQHRLLDEPAERAERALKDKLVRYETGQRAVAEVEARRAAAAQRLAQQEAEVEAALRAEAEGRAVAPVAPVFVPPAPVAAPPRVEGIAFKSTWSARVTDLKGLVRAVAENRAPVECLEPAQVYLNARARAEKSALAIPGVEAIETRVAAAKA